MAQPFCEDVQSPCYEDYIYTTPESDIKALDFISCYISLSLIGYICHKHKGLHIIWGREDGKAKIVFRKNFTVFITSMNKEDWKSMNLKDFWGNMTD